LIISILENRIAEKDEIKNVSTHSLNKYPPKQSINKSIEVE